MIQFQEAWAKRMDGSHVVAQKVNAINALSIDHISAGDAVDYALAIVCEYSTTPHDAADHLEYVISELTKARENIKQATRDEAANDINA